MSLKLSINVLDKLKKQKSSRQNDFEEMWSKSIKKRKTKNQKFKKMLWLKESKKNAETGF